MSVPAARAAPGPLPALLAASAAVVAQGLAALASVLVQVFAARQLGAAGYGAFAVLNGVLLVVLALQNGWVGDSLTVLDRWEPQVRSALTLSLLVFLALGASSSLVATLVLGYGSWAVAAQFALMSVAYLAAEFCRRVFMTRLEFWALSLNNAVFVLATWAVLELQSRDSHPGELGGFALAVAGGSAVAVAVAAVQLPLAELRPTRLSRTGVGELSRFAVWRAAQVGVRPVALLVLRLVVVTVSGRAVLGQVEAARLLMAPAMTFAQGVGSFVLPTYADEARTGRPSRIGMRTVTAGVVAVTLVLCAVPLLLPGTAQDLLTGGSFDIPLSAVLGWGVFSVAFACGLPSANRLVARRRSREVLQIRLLDALVGLAGVLLLVSAGAAYGVAFGLAAGAALGAVLTLRLSSRESAAGRHPDLEPVP